MYRYIHDNAARTIYRFPSEPQVVEQKNRGKRVGWRITMDYIITRADNWLEGGSWQFPTSAHSIQHLDAHYTRDLALSYFGLHHEPKGEAISIKEYERLHAEYTAEASSRRHDAAI